MCSSITLHGVVRQEELNLEHIQEFLEEDSSSINLKNVWGYTPLHIALANKTCSVDVIQLLLRYGADVHVFDNYERSILCFAYHNGASINVIRSLLDSGCALNGCRSEYHGSVLHCTTSDPESVLLNSDVLKMLIERGADINAVNNEGETVMCSALQNGNEESTIKLLLEVGGSLNSCPVHTSPLKCATGPSYLVGGILKESVVKVFLEAGVDMQNIDGKGFTALQFALRWCNYETEAIVLLLNCHKDTNLNSLVDDHNNSLLHFALYNKYCKLSVVKILVQRGVKVDQANMKGDTPLNKAMKNHKCQPSVLKFLLKKGAKVEFESLKLAVKNHQGVEIFKLLFAFSAPISETSFQSILKLEHQSNYFSTRVVCFQYLLRVYLLQVSNYCLSTFENQFHQDVINFRGMCVGELIKMKSTNIGGGHTLHEFLRSCSSPNKHAAKKETKDQVFNVYRFYNAIANNAFPYYFDIIADKVGKRSMEENLEKVTMSAAKSSRMKKRVEQIVLPYECLLKVSQFLGKEDLLRFILASFVKVDCSRLIMLRDQAHLFQDNPEKKRKTE